MGRSITLPCGSRVAGQLVSVPPRMTLFSVDRGREEAADAALDQVDADVGPLGQQADPVAFQLGADDPARAVAVVVIVGIDGQPNDLPTLGLRGGDRRQSVSQVDRQLFRLERHRPAVHVDERTRRQAVKESASGQGVCAEFSEKNVCRFRHVRLDVGPRVLRFLFGLGGLHPPPPCPR
jgi:hypothetical protein